MTTSNARTQSTSPNQTTSPTVAIIGAGPGGLAAAILLAASGVSVRVYEAAGVIGGRTARITQHGASGTYHFDTGPTFFMMPYVLDEIFAAAGKKLTDYATLHRLDPMYRLLIGQKDGTTRTLDATQNLDEMVRRISAVSPHDGAAFKRFIDDNRYKLRHSESILRNPMRSPLDLFRSETWKDSLKVAPVLAPHKSVHQMLSSYFEHPDVRLAVCFQSKYLGMSPYECPSLFTILPFIEYEYGIWHPVGGCNALMGAMAEVARELGVEIVTGAPVTGLEFAKSSEGPRVSAVRIGGNGPLAGSTILHDHVVLNADATWAMKNLIPSEIRAEVGGDYSDATLDAKKYSCSTYMVYAGVKGPVDLPHHTIYISSSYEQNLAEITSNAKLSHDPSMYICNPSAIDPSLAPEGCSAVYMLMPTPNCSGGIDWAANEPMLRRAMLDQARTKMGVDLAGRIETEVGYTPSTWLGQNINFGATFNLAHNLTQMLHWRPQNKLRGFDNLYLVGGGTHPGSGLPTIFLSAQISARLLCEKLGKQFAGGNSTVRAISTQRTMRSAEMLAPHQNNAKHAPNDAPDLVGASS